MPLSSSVGVVYGPGMRQHHYNFAHRILPLDATREPGLWGIISSDRAASYLQTRWSDAAPSSDVQPSKGLIWIEPVRVNGVEIRTIRMPPPENPAEAYYGAIARSPDGVVRYFVAEKGNEGAFLAEWRTNMRIRGGDLEEKASFDKLAVFRDQPSNSAPWEVSSSSIPGMPYLGSFLLAVAEEMSNAEANAMCKPAAAPVRGPAAPIVTTSDTGNANLIVWIVIGVAIIIIVLVGLTR
jgi:hypothetical protein